MRKRRTREHVIADLGVNHVERIILTCGFVAERLYFDYGYDLAMVTFSETGEFEPGIVYLQVKATDHPDRVDTGASLALPLDRRDVEAWTAEPAPVYLVLFDAQARSACWLDVREFFARHPEVMNQESTTITVRIPLRQRLDEAAVRHMRSVKNDRIRG